MSYIKIVILLIIRMIRVLIRARMVVLVKFYSYFGQTVFLLWPDSIHFTVLILTIILIMILLLFTLYK